MSNASLILHCGAREVSAEQLKAVLCPPSEGRWRPVPHATVLQYAADALTEAGYEIDTIRLGSLLEADRNPASLPFEQIPT